MVKANMPVGVRTSSPTQMAYLIINLTKTNVSGLGDGERNCFYNMPSTIASVMEDMSFYKMKYVGDLLSSICGSLDRKSREFLYIGNFLYNVVSNSALRKNMEKSR